MTFDEVKRLSSEQFIRDVGISVDLFWDIRARILACIQEEHSWFPIKKRGKKPKTLRVEDKLLLTFYYLRHYPTFDQLGRQFGISESYANKLFHQYLDFLVKVLRLPGRKALLEHGLDAIIIDVTEQPIERPTKKQRQYYSGKKKRHTINAQLVVCLVTLQILTVVCGKGCTHDFKLVKQRAFRIRSDVEKYGDSGYQGLDTLYPNSFTPIKKKKETPLTKDQKAYNRLLATLRIPIEHVNRRCNIFRSVKEIYRGKHKHYHKIWTVIAALVNCRYAE